MPSPHTVRNSTAPTAPATATHSRGGASRGQSSGSGRSSNAGMATKATNNTSPPATVSHAP